MRIRSQASWDAVDRAASSALGSPVVAVPSVRVALCWIMQHLGYARHRDHVLVPRFMGRCILNALNRTAFPVEAQTPQTRLALVVNQYGLPQRLDEIGAACASRGLRYVEDRPAGIAISERLGPGSLAACIGFSKVLPALQGAAVLSHDDDLLQFCRTRRAETSPWSWALFVMLALLRRRSRVGASSVLAELAYELYLPARGGNAALRTGMIEALQQLDEYARRAGERLALLQERFAGRLLSPEGVRLPYVVPLLTGDGAPQVSDILARHGFDSQTYHIDVNRNMFNPAYEPACLIPLTPRIPETAFRALVGDLHALTCDVRPPEPRAGEPVPAGVTAPP
jgi:hypothetical protein